MKNRYLPFLSLCIGLLAGAVSCKDDATDDPAAAAIEITTQPIAAPAAGGTLQIAYRIVPAAEGGGIVAASADDAWLHDFDCSQEGIVTFTADPNEGAERTTNVTLSKAGANSASLTVTQAAFGTDEKHFSVSTADLTSSGVTFRIQYKAPDEGAYFTWNLMSSADFKAHYKSSEELIAAELQDLVENQLPDYKAYVDPNGTFTDILSRIADTRRINVLKPQTEYTLYAFGVSPERKATTGVETYTFTTPAFQVVDPCTFEIEFTDVKQVEFKISITPDNDNTRYYLGFIDGAALQESTPEEIASQFIQRAESYEINWGAHDALRTGPCTLHTFKDLELSDLQADTDYAVLAFGVSALGERTTEVAHKIAHTAPVEITDMTFDVDIVETAINGVKIQVTPSYPDKTYMAGCIRKAEYDKFEGDDTRFMEYVVANGNVTLLEGTQLIDRTNALLADTEYIFFAFGYAGGITTPAPKIVPFSTGDYNVSGQAEIEILSIEVTGPDPDPNAVNYVLLEAKVQVNDKAAHWYVTHFNSIDGAACNAFSGEPLTDTEIITALTSPGSGISVTKDALTAEGYCKIGNERTFYAIAVDAEGNYGPLVRKSIIPTQEMLP